MEIRKATMDNFEELLQLKLESKEDERAYNKLLEPVDKVKANYKEYLEKDIKGEWRAAIIAIENKKIIGMVIGRIYRSLRVAGYERRASMGNLYVKPEYRKKGMAKKLIEAFTDWAKSKEVKRITLSVYIDNKQVQDMYKKLGFKENNISMHKKI